MLFKPNHPWLQSSTHSKNMGAMHSRCAKVLYRLHCLLGHLLGNPPSLDATKIQLHVLNRELKKRHQVRFSGLKARCMAQQTPLQL